MQKIREIKFRAWDQNNADWNKQNAATVGKKLQEMYLWEDLCEYGIDVFESDSWQFMQYTGLKDKNGKEIYEGDIVEAWSEGSKGVFEVKWRQEGAPMWILFPNWQHKKHWRWEDLYYWKLHGSKDRKTGQYTDDVLILGNIYENTELLQSSLNAR